MQPEFAPSAESIEVDSLVELTPKGEQISDENLMEIAAPRFCLKWAQDRARKAALRQGKKLYRIKKWGFLVMDDKGQALDVRRIEHRKRDLGKEITERAGVDVNKVPPLVRRFNEHASMNAASELVSHQRMLEAPTRRYLRTVEHSNALFSEEHVEG